jgi:hypothetical protein
VPRRDRLEDLLVSGRLKAHRPTEREISDIFSVADRGLQDAGAEGLSTDGRFAAAYGAALALVTVVVCASGYRIGRVAGHHRLTFDVLPQLMGAAAAERARYFNASRAKRNLSEYERAGVVSRAEADALVREANAFRAEVEAWLREVHPDLHAS